MLDDDRAVHAAVERVERRLAELDERAAPELRAALDEALAALLDLYGEGLRRILTQAARAAGGDVRPALAGDEWVAQLLLLHGLHPEDTATRVAQALDRVRPLLATHAGDVELLEVREGVVRLRLLGTCNGCPASSQTLRLTIEGALRAAAPEVERIETVQDAATPDGAHQGLVCGSAPGLAAAPRVAEDGVS